jgi:hypothetical protein
MENIEMKGGAEETEEKRMTERVWMNDRLIMDDSMVSKAKERKSNEGVEHSFAVTAGSEAVQRDQMGLGLWSPWTNPPSDAIDDSFTILRIDARDEAAPILTPAPMAFDYHCSNDPALGAGLQEDQYTLSVPALENPVTTPETSSNTALSSLPNPDHSPKTSKHATSTRKAQTPRTNNSFVPFSTYQFLQPNDLEHISPEDISFLEEQSCFQIPSRPMLDEFVAHYFLHVHPIIPMIEEGDFWDSYTKAEQDRDPNLLQLSLTLFQCMLFSVASVSSRPLRELNAIAFGKLLIS